MLLIQSQFIFTDGNLGNLKRLVGQNMDLRDTSASKNKM